MGGRPASAYAYFDAPFLALAHRGGHSPAAPAAVENSLRAFTAARDLGYRYLETDVHTTADGVLVAFHDEVLDRTCDATGRVADMPWDAVARARIGGTEPIPTLDDLLDAFPDARLNIDLKAPGAVEPLARALAHHGAEGRVCVGSFDTGRLRRFRSLSGGRVATSATPVEVGVFAQAPGVRQRFPLGAQAFQVPLRHRGVPIVHPRFVAAAHRRGAQVHVWTINDRATMEHLIDLGVDGIVTDDITTLKAVLTERDLWEGNP